MEELIVRGAPLAPRTQVSIQKLAMKSISLGKNSRLRYDDDELAGLMQSIKEEGLLQPIGVLDRGNGKFEVAYGNRRFIACQKLGLKLIPAIIHQVTSESDSDIKNLTENVQRKNTSLSEVGRYIVLLEEQGLSPGEIAARLGKSKAYVNSCKNAFSGIPEEFREDIEAQSPGSPRRTKGKIPVTIVNRAVNAYKSGFITKPVMKNMLRKAKDPKFDLGLADNYIASHTRKGARLPVSIQAARSGKRVLCMFHMTEKEVKRIEKAYVKTGEYKSIVAVARAIIRGNLVESFNIADEH